MKKFTVFLCGVVLVFGLASNAGALTMLTWTDKGTYAPSYGGANPIEYSLMFEEGDENTSYFEGAVFTITIKEDVDVGPPEWRVGWIAFHFSPFGGVITDLSTSGTEDTWYFGKPGDSVPWGNAGGQRKNPFEVPWAGFYAYKLEQSIDGAVGGEWLTKEPATYEFVFDFHILDPGKVFILETMPFQVGFYDGYTNPNNNKKVKTALLSEHLVVPEPATMLLLGAGLIGLAAVGRKRFFKKA